MAPHPVVSEPLELQVGGPVTDPRGHTAVQPITARSGSWHRASPSGPQVMGKAAHPTRQPSTPSCLDLSKSLPDRGQASSAVDPLSGHSRQGEVPAGDSGFSLSWSPPRTGSSPAPQSPLLSLFPSPHPFSPLPTPRTRETPPERSCRGLTQVVQCIMEEAAELDEFVADDVWVRRPPSLILAQEITAQQEAKARSGGVTQPGVSLSAAPARALGQLRPLSATPAREGQTRARKEPRAHGLGGEACSTLLRAC